MTAFSAGPPVTAEGRRGRRAAAFALCAGAFALLAPAAGCSSPTPSLTPRMAISLAADKTQSLTSMTATFSDYISSAPAATLGTIELQMKPLLVDSDATASADGQTSSSEEIVSTTAMYLKGSLAAAVTGRTRKPWVEIPFARPSGSHGASLLQDMPNGDPVTETRMLAAAKNVRSLGTQVLNGVRTTHYTGSFTAPAALASLSPALRKQVAPLLNSVSGDIRFNAWIDANHVVRRISEVENLSGETVHLTVNVTSVDRPVHIAVPSASETVVLTKNIFVGV